MAGCTAVPLYWVSNSYWQAAPLYWILATNGWLHRCTALLGVPQLLAGCTAVQGFIYSRLAAALQRCIGVLASTAWLHRCILGLTSTSWLQLCTDVLGFQKELPDFPKRWTLDQVRPVRPYADGGMLSFGVRCAGCELACELSERLFRVRWRRFPFAKFWVLGFAVP